MSTSNRNPLQKLFDATNKARDPTSAMDVHVEEAAMKPAGGGNKRVSVERIYQKKTQLEHILLRPDTYIGSVESATQQMWVYDGEEVGMVKRDITFVPGLYKIFDEILVNAADNKQRDKNMDVIKIDIDPENNVISIYNNGKGIPIVEHQVEKVFVPALIFGQLLTSSNYDDDEKKVTGGRNGFGAKLCNIFSTKFTVETACKEYKKVFKQSWSNNMTKTTEAKIKTYTGDDFTKITFSPDLTKFKMDTLDKDIVALMCRRAYDVAGSSRGVKVFLNGKKLPIKCFKDYVDQYVKGKMDDMGNPFKIVYDNSSSARWEIAITMSDSGFQQISFVNSIATTKGGRHVDYIVDQITAKLQELVKKKNKGGVAIKPFQIKNHLWVFINCLIENPTFDSQTKENMTLMVKSFGSRCILTEKYIALVTKCGVMDSILSWVKYKAETLMNKKCHATKHAKLKGILKLEDANNAGTKNSSRCTLIVTEGDSAKTLAVSGLAVVGRDDYGVFPLRGKMLNVREASHKQILENAEINHLIRILGLQYKKQYKSREDLLTLRYGKLMIMTDQDQDGSHIKGLIINFIHTNWPDLLRLHFLEEFITPIVKVSKGKQEKISFYSLPEFEEWKKKTEKWHTWKVKYYKGLGTSTTDEAKEYFNDMDRHRIYFEHKSVDDDKAITMAFSKKMVDARKEWLSVGMEDRKRRRELGLSEQYLYGKGTTTVTYQDFINKELILFSNLDNERSIPSLVDGLKPGQRKVLFTCFKRNDKHEVKVAQLAGSVAEHSAYHHGEASLMSTIINLAQNFIGSNNINLLMPNGMFGTRLQGGKDAASPRYIFTMLSSLARHIFNTEDLPLLTYHNEDNQKIEPEWYIPIIPTVLVNGADGIGTGWMTKVPNYDTREIVKNLKLMIHGQEPVPMIPSFKHFRGTIVPFDVQRYAVSGEIGIIDEKTLEITELPVRTWTQAYKESVLEPMLHGTDKIPSTITDYKEYNSDTTVRFVVSMSEEKLAEGERTGLHKMFKLQTSMSTSSMVLFDRNGVLKKYNSPEEIMQEFFDVRMEYYIKRKAYLIGMMEANCRKINNMTRFILEKISGDVVFENKKRKVIIEELFKKGYDSDPLKEWKRKISEEVTEEVSDDEEKNAEEDEHDYDYLMKMPGWNYTLERKNQLMAERDKTEAELEALKKKSPSDLWEDDLDKLMIELDAVEEKERHDAGEAMSGKTIKAARGKKGKAPAMAAKFTQPSANARKVEPLIDAELKKRAERAADVAVKRANKKKDTSSTSKSDSFKDDASEPEILSLSERIGLQTATTNDKAPAAKKRTLKQTTIKFPKSQAKKGSPKKKNKKNPWSDDELDSSADNSDMDESSVAVAPRERGSRRATAGKAVYKIDSDSESEEEMVTNKAVVSSDEEAEPVAPKPAAKKPAVKPTKPITVDDSESDTAKNKAAAGENNFDSDSDSIEMDKKKAPSKALQSSLFDSLMEGAKTSDGGDGDNNNGTTASSAEKNDDLASSKEELIVPAAPIPAARKKPVPKSKRRKSSDEESEENLAPKKKRPATVARSAKFSDDSDKEVLPKKKKLAASSRRPDSSDTEDGYIPKSKKAAAGGRKPAIKKKVVKVDSDDDDDEDVFPKKSKKKTAMSDDDDMEDFVPRNPRARAARSKAPVKYNFGEDSEED